MYISNLKVLLKPSNATCKEISNQVEGKPSSNKAATPPCKREKVESNVPIIDLEEVHTTYVDYTLAAPWQSIGRTALNMSDRGCIISGDKLNNKHVNFAQMLIKQHFKHLEGLKYPVVLSTLEPFPTTTNVLQIMHTPEDHWFVASTMRCAEGKINIYDSFYGSVEASTASLIAKLFGDAELKMKTCPRQLGDKDCGVFAIANCAAIVHGINLEGIKFLQDNMRQHLLLCLEQQHLCPFPYALDS